MNKWKRTIGLGDTWEVKRIQINQSFTRQLKFNIVDGIDIGLWEKIDLITRSNIMFEIMGAVNNKIREGL